MKFFKGVAMKTSTFEIFVLKIFSFLSKSVFEWLGHLSGVWEIQAEGPALNRVDPELTDTSGTSLQGKCPDPLSKSFGPSVLYCGCSASAK